MHAASRVQEYQVVCRLDHQLSVQTADRSAACPARHRTAQQLELMDCQIKSKSCSRVTSPQRSPLPEATTAVTEPFAACSNFRFCSSVALLR